MLVIKKETDKLFRRSWIFLIQSLLSLLVVLHILNFSLLSSGKIFWVHGFLIWMPEIHDPILHNRPPLIG